MLKCHTIPEAAIHLILFTHTQPANATLKTQDGRK
jgi:hypothetical protein